MVQITIQGATLVPLALVGSPVPLEVATFEENRVTKMRIYPRIQAFSDTSLLIGLENTTFQMKVRVPQDFVNGDNIENLMTHLRLQDQVLVDIENVKHAVRITQISELHQGGIPGLWELDISATETYNSSILAL